MSSTTENYLKRIFAEAERSGEPLVSLGEIATSLNVTPGTVTTMVKGLADAGLVDYRPRQGVALTAEGRIEALAVLRRHRLIELFLVEVLGMDWAEVHDEAEVLEHVISDRLLDRIDEILGRPEKDPHGDPIPGPNGELPEPEGEPLTEIEPPCELEILRVDHGDRVFLEYLKDSGLVPGALVTLVERSAPAGTVTVESTPLGVDVGVSEPTASERHPVTIGMSAARRIRVLIRRSGT